MFVSFNIFKLNIKRKCFFNWEETELQFILLKHINCILENFKQITPAWKYLLINKTNVKHEYQVIIH